MACPGLPGPHPGVQRGLPTPAPRRVALLRRRKSAPKKAPPTPRSPDSFAQSVSIYGWKHLCPLNLRSCYLICSLVVNETSPAGLLKGNMFLLALDETYFLYVRALGSTRRNRQTGPIGRSCGGIPKGASPLCVVVGVGYIRGGTPSKGVPPLCALLGTFPAREKYPGVRGRRPRKSSNRMEPIREKNVISPTRPAARESKRIGALRWHRRIKKWGPGAEPPKSGAELEAPRRHQ